MTPISLVPKKNRKMRMVWDFRKLNRKTKFNSYPLPNINEILSSIPKSAFYSTLDLKRGYHHVKLMKSDQFTISIVTPNGLFKYIVLPFGLRNASQHFMKIIKTILDIPENKALVFLDVFITVGKIFKTI